MDASPDSAHDPRAGQPSGPRVLVLGRRQGLEAALRRLGVPFALWLEQAPQFLPRGVHVHVAPFHSTRKAVDRVARCLTEAGPFTHCVAAVESAVVTASHARRTLGARSSPHTVARRCSDKLYMKQRLRAAGVPVTAFVDLSHPAGLSGAQELGRPLVVKERSSSGSRGVRVVTDWETPLAASSAPRRIAERFVVGDEMSVESFVHEGRIVWSSTTCYWRPKHVNVVPAGLAPERLAAVLDLNRRAIEALAIRWGMTHLELFLTADGPIVGEVALRAPGGYIMRCIELAYGFDPWEALCEVELGRMPVIPPAAGRPTAVIVLHPGAGTVKRVHGLEQVRTHPAHVDTHLKVEAGSRVPPRLGVGVDVGRVLLQAGDQGALEAAIRFVEQHLVIELES